MAASENLDSSAQQALDAALDKIREAERTDSIKLDLSGLGFGPALRPDWMGWEMLGRLETLEWLDVDRNGIGAIPPNGWAALGRRRRLRVLNLDDNQLASIPPEGWQALSQLENLNHLRLNGNGLSIPPEGWDALGRCTKLESLDLGDNHLEDIPVSGWQALGRLRRLRSLRVFDNLIRDIPPEALDPLRQLANLSFLNLTGNPLPEELLAAVSRGRQGLIDYLEATRSRAAHPRTVKLMFLGEPASGKTTLVEALNGNTAPCDPQREETIGVNVRRIEKTSPQDGRPLYLATWDFAGQYMEYATHQFFLKPGGICLILWKARLGSDYGQRDLWYWLELLKMRVKDAEFLLVTTHTGKTPAALDLREVQASYPGCLGHFEVELSDGTGVAALEQKILELAAASPAMRAVWPAPWLAVRDAIRDMRAASPYLFEEDFWKLCAEKEVTDRKAQRDLADQLDKLGEVVYYAAEPLSRLVILNPTWVTELVAKVVRDKPVRDQGGTITSADLDRIWGPLPRIVRDHLESLMDEYDLVYKTPAHLQESTSIVVEALPPAPEDLRDRDFSDGRPQTEMIYRFPTLVRHLPPGVPTWAFARSHRYKKKSAGLWRNAAWFEDVDTNSEAMVFSSEVDREVRVRVAADYPPYFFGVLDGILRDTFQRYPGVQPVCMIPCPCRPGCKHGHPREIVLKRKRDGKSDVSCPLTGEDVAIAKLLEGFVPANTEAGLLASLAELRRLMTAILNGQNEELIQSCPSLFTLAPAKDFKLLDSYVEYATGKEELELSLYCEWEKQWHTTPYSVYRFRPEQAWFSSVKQHWSKFAGVTKQVAPLAGAFGGLLGAASAVGAVKELVENAQTTVGTVSKDPSGSLASELKLREHPGLIDLEGRHLLARLIKHLDAARGATQPEFGGLHAYHLKEDGRLLWLCAEHRERYQSSC